ncbi:MAG: hypothetical protein Q8Q60_01720 [Candidatus Chromulinivorax sp.]|nr:hypothetical protein [Candidatus Chromulinivorax sp.]
MKKLYNYLLFIVFCTKIVVANTLEVTNLTSGQITITIQTSSETTTQTIPVNANPILNDVNEPQPHSTIISFTNNPIQKIVITRFTPNMSQTIYYDGQNTFDNQQVPGGMHNLDITGQGRMIVWKDYVELNNVAYSLTDLQSYIVRCNALQASLSANNLDATQKQLNDITAAVQSVRESDFGPQLSMQLITIQTSIDAIANDIKTMKILQASLQTIQDMQNNVSLGNNNLTGTNKPYQPADDSLERTQKTLHQLRTGLTTILQSNLTGVVAQQAQALQSAIDSLQSIVDQMKTSQSAINFDSMMIQPTTNLKSYQNT